MESEIATQTIIWWVGICAGAGILGIFVLWLGKQLLINEELDSLNIRWKHLHDFRHASNDGSNLSKSEADTHPLRPNNSILWMKLDMNNDVAIDWNVWGMPKRRLQALEERVQAIERRLGMDSHL